MAASAASRELSALQMQQRLTSAHADMYFGALIKCCVADRQRAQQDYAV